MPRRVPALSAAVRVTSKLLGNTPAVARASYIHPGVVEASTGGLRAVAPASAGGVRSGDP